jgi:4-hydroxybenzoate polyprenyltransferase
LLAELRPHQWSKNLLVFVPLATSHRVFEVGLCKAAATALLCFSLCASAVYVINDLLDLQADRRHPQKRLRPLAAGSLPLSWAAPLAATLLLLGFGLAISVLPWLFSVVLAAYFLLTCGYSLFAKRVAMLDVLALSGLYAIRVFAGGVATQIVVSEWLIVFSVFLFTSLAFAKRYAELTRLARDNQGAAEGRQYRVADLGLLETLGPCSGYIAVLVLALYVKDWDRTGNLYRNPWPLWLLCPLLMYWVSRLWIKAKRNELAEDPVVFALRDRVSLMLGAAALLLVVGATWF